RGFARRCVRRPVQGFARNPLESQTARSMSFARFHPLVAVPDFAHRPAVADFPDFPDFPVLVDSLDPDFVLRHRVPAHHLDSAGYLFALAVVLTVALPICDWQWLGEIPADV